MHRNTRTALAVFSGGGKPRKRLRQHRALKHPAGSEVFKVNGHSAATDSFCPCCFADTGRTAAARCDAFLRCK